MTLERFIYALGIRKVGKEVSKILAEYILENFNGDFYLFVYALTGNKEFLSDNKD